MTVLTSLSCIAGIILHFHAPQLEAARSAPMQLDPASTKAALDALLAVTE